VTSSLDDSKMTELFLKNCRLRSKLSLLNEIKILTMSWKTSIGISMITITLLTSNNNQTAIAIPLTNDFEQKIAQIKTTEKLQEQIDNFFITILPIPTFRQDAPLTIQPNIQSQKTSINLELISSSDNLITDTESWFAENKLTLPIYDVPNSFMQVVGNVPDSIPTKYQNNFLIQAIKSENTPNIIFLIYGVDFGDGRYLFAFNLKTNQIEYGYDFSNYIFAPEYEPTEQEFVNQRIFWVEQIDDILYISHGHNTYATSSKGMNAYLTAINTKERQVIWESQPLVANSANFLILGDVIISGYGFTAEPDFIYLLNRETGEILQQIPLKSAPDYLITKDNQLYVRTYNTDYIFQIKK
jgi:hypothetical protein